MDLAHVRHRDPEPAAAGGGVERVLVPQRLRQHGQRFADGARQALRARRGQHALPRAHEQIVAEGVAQAAQRVADGRLRQVHPPRHGRQVAVFEQVLEQQQQVQVDVAQLCHGVSYYS